MGLNYTDVKLDLTGFILKGEREAHRCCLAVTLGFSSDAVADTVPPVSFLYYSNYFSRTKVTEQIIW